MTDPSDDIDAGTTPTGGDPYREIFERNPRPMWVYDAATLEIVAANDAAVAQYGYTQAEFTSLTIRDLRIPAEHARLDRYMEARPAGLANAGTWRHRRRDGSELDVEIMSHDVKWNGRPARVVTAYDASGRLRRRLEVEAALASLATAVTSGPDGDLTSVLGMLAGLLGAARAYLLIASGDGRTFRRAAVWPASASSTEPASAWPDPAVVREWVRGVRGEAVFAIEDVPALDATSVWPASASARALLDAHGVGSVLAVPVRRRDGVLLGALGFDDAAAGRGWSDEDVRALRLAAGIVAKELDRRRATDALRASEERLRLILAQLPAVLWTTDSVLRATALQGAYAEASYAELGDDTPAGALLSLLGVTGDGAEVIDAHRRALAGDAMAVEWPAGERWFQAHIEPLVDEAGEVIGTIGVALDVTERRALEEQLRYSQRMETVGRLAGGVAHDFNNILTAITGHAGFLLDALAPDDPRHDDAAEIRQAAARAATLTRQLLVVARKEVAQPTVLEPRDVLTGMRGMLRPLLGETHLLRLHIAPDVGRVIADRGQLEQVIMNLALNARDAMPAGGTIDVALGNTTLDDDDARRLHYVVPGAYVRLAVTDHGVGMDADTQAHVFEPFFTTKTAGKGTGLGLSTAYAVVKSAGGYIWLHSAPGRGTSVEVLLPRTDAPVEPVHDHAATSVSGRVTPLPDGRGSTAAPSDAGSDGREPSPPPTIVLVEDEDSVRSIVRRTLEGRGFHVLAASGGEEALELCRRHDGPIDLLVTDVVMPGLSGREVADRLETLRPGTRTLFMSGYTADEIIRRGIVTEAIAFIEKPFAPSQLIARIHEELLGRMNSEG